MRENEFEKKVQRQMEELQLSPSAAVWTRVEKELVKKKRRRIIFFIILLAGLGLPGYYILHTGSSPELARQEVGLSFRDSSSSPIKKPADNHPPVPIPASDPIPGESAGTTATASLATVHKKKGGTKTIARPPAVTESNVLYHYTKPATGKKDQPAGTTELTSKQKPVPSPSDGKNGNVPQPPGKTTSLVSIENGKDPTDSLLTEKPVTAPGQPLAGEKKKKPFVQWGIDASGGMAFNRAHIFSLSTSLRPEAYLDNSASAPGGGSGSQRTRPPSAIRPGAALKLGIVAVRELSARSSLSAGLRYTYISEKIETGAYKDTTILANSYQSPNTSINGIYRSTAGHTYTNRYHFIELPLYYQLQLSKGNKPALLWNAGVSAGWLVAARALVYDTAAGGVYYHNNDAFNRFHVNVHTGFSFRFGNKTTNQWSVGPEFSLGMRQFMKPDAIVRSRYLLYGGITGRVLFNRSKK